VLNARFGVGQRRSFDILGLLNEYGAGGGICGARG